MPGCRRRRSADQRHIDQIAEQPIRSSQHIGFGFQPLQIPYDAHQRDIRDLWIWHSASARLCAESRGRLFEQSVQVRGNPNSSLRQAGFGRRMVFIDVVVRERVTIRVDDIADRRALGNPEPQRRPRAVALLIQRSGL